MEESSKQRLHSVILSESHLLSKESHVSTKELNEPKELNEYKDNNIIYESFICCFTNKWCFDHMNPASYRIYDETHEIYCICFDCCNWCLEFEQNKCLCCKKNSICFMCCCTIRFK